MEAVGAGAEAEAGAGAARGEGGKGERVSGAAVPSPRVAGETGAQGHVLS